MVAWHGAGGMGMGSGIRISAFFCGGVETCTGGRLGWNMGLRRVTILASLGSSAAAFLAFFFAFLDLAGGAGGGGSGMSIVFGGSVNK